MKNHTNENKLSPTVMMRTDRRIRDKYRVRAKRLKTTMVSETNSALLSYLKPKK